VPRPVRFGAGVLALAFLALHLSYLPASLEDLDSINFALGLRDFDVARHQPHPPGYPVFIAAARIVYAVVPSEAHALGLLAMVSRALAALALVALFGALDEHPSRRTVPLTAALLAVTSPLFWMTSARPLSDLVGLAAVLGVQVLTVRARSPRAFVAASFCAACAAGIRSQAVWLTAPLLAFVLLRHVLSDNRKLPEVFRLAGMMAAGYLAGALVWLVPLVALTGGPAEYMRVLFNQGAEDFSGVVMLWTTPTVRQLARVLHAAFVAPWSLVPIASAVLALAAVGFFVMLRRSRPALMTLAAAFGPYLVFDLVFQESITTRYALPLVVPVAYAAVRGADLIRSRVLVALVAALAAFNVFNGMLALSGYSGREAPAFQLLDNMAVSARRSRSAPPVLAMHRRDEFDLRRPIAWVGDRMPAFASRLPSPPKHEWLEVVKYWNGGGRAPVWFVADPPRSDLALFRRQRAPVQYRWPFSLPFVMGGVRPNEMDWHTIDPPDWYLGEGWALTPETAGVAREDGRGPSRGGIQGWIRRWSGQTTLLVGGRNLAAGGAPVRLRLDIDGRIADEATAAPGFFLRLLTLPAGRLSGAGDYATATITAEPASADLAIEQFDVQPQERLVFGYSEGWNELEYNPATGRLWRWTSERAALRVRAPAGERLTLRLEGELEEASSSHVTIRVGDRVVSEHDVGVAFSIESTVPAGLLVGDDAAITIETSAWYIPAERRWRSGDQRHLGLKVYSCVLVPAS
jgi:hypothetical protein